MDFSFLYYKEFLYFKENNVVMIMII